MSDGTKPTFERGTLVELRSGGPAMVVRDIVADEVVCRWFAGDVLKEKTFYVDEVQSHSSGGLAERVERARARVAEHRQEELSERELARRITLMVEQSKRGGPPVPDSIVKLVEDASSHVATLAIDPE